MDSSGAPPPSNRSLHTAVLHKDSLYIFGGYDGAVRVNDFYEFHFPTRRWVSLYSIDDTPPCARDRHTAVVYDNSLYIFGGFDGSSRKNDFYAYNFDSQCWGEVLVVEGLPPSARHSHCAVVHETSM